ncbi:anti-sigma-D factor RsdA [Antrihabitans stalactiti]|uniref:Anti-sigma-D factor RsdA sigma factor binding region domain-containing protein n=1 Tax=Antrihabitans stalactiti TaxID=2584121 RepID=A0A848KGI3_9NOCA|nr:anti-sigma-D factor RsdA [Antrihabitans stalactiti]NMN96204.1 hypothetical protein [Antrihabitans stalactiti]
MARDSKRGRFGAGSQHADPYADANVDGTPVDIAAVRRDDELIDAIASDGPVATDSTDEYQIASLLANWRAELTMPPLPAAPDIDTVFAAVNQEIGARAARANAGGRLRLVRPIVGAAAAIALVVGGMTAFSYNAEPGDPLWKVKQVVFSEQANSTMANIDTSSDLEEAQKLLDSGKPAAAKEKLEHAASRVTDVNDAQDRDALLEMWKKLNEQIAKVLPTAPGSNTTSQPTSPESSVSVETKPSPSTSPKPNPALVPGDSSAVTVSPTPKPADSTPPETTTTTDVTTTTTQAPVTTTTPAPVTSSEPPPVVVPPVTPTSAANSAPVPEPPVIETSGSTSESSVPQIPGLRNLTR